MKMIKLNFKTLRNISLIGGALFMISCKNEGTTTVVTTEPNTEVETETQAPEINKDLLVGSWKDKSEAALDFTLFEDGTAQSDNMKTMLYKNWKVDGNQVTFTIESIGNENTFTGDQTYTIEKLTENELILKDGTLISEYTKK